MAVFMFACPACDASLSAGTDQSGTCVLCPRCEVLLQVPDHEAPAIPREKDPRWTASVPTADEAPVQFRPRHDERDAEMDMTPMVDVTFLLLIFFMVTAAFSMQKSFEVPTPENEQAAARPIQDIETDSDYVIVRVDEFNTFHVGATRWDEEKEAPTEKALLARLSEARRGTGSAPGATRMLVMASGQAYHEKVVTAMDAGTSVGMEDVKLVTVEDE
jgi:biopolymer transport protein ExbD